MLDVNKIYCGNCIDLMKQISDESIDLTVTSPPYDNLRDYKGYDFKFEDIAKELYRVTKKGGVVVWVVGDATIDGSETGSSFKQALKFKEVGFNLHDTMIYAKTNLACPSHGRYNNQFEYMFILSKGNPKTFNPIIDRENKTSGNKEKAKIRAQDGTIKRSGKERITQPFGMRFNIWYYTPGSTHSSSDNHAKNHPAIFPEKLAEDHILSWSNEGDFVFDPMCGSGTTPKMAYLNNRKFIGIDISEEYCEIARKRIFDSMLQTKLVL